MDVCICSGYPLSSPKGNSVTAKRLELGFSERGLQVVAVHSEKPPAARHLVALNAIKTASAIDHFQKKCPESKVHVMLTGTDIHGGIQEDPELAESVFFIATTLVVAHPECIHEIPAQWHHKVRVIYPSVEFPEIPDSLAVDKPIFTCLGHLREVKNPHLMFQALTCIDDEVRAVSLGDALEQVEAEKARENEKQDARYAWRSGIDRPHALDWLRKSFVTLNTSFLEGGSNVVMEAICLGVPVLATNIDGNRGLLGSDYLGLFPSNDASALADLMKQCLHDENFYARLVEQVEERKGLFTREKEVEAWLDIFNKHR